MRAGVLGAAVFVALTTAGGAQAQSFDCARAAKPDERAICADADLSALDEQLADLYTRQRARLDARQKARLAESQTIWLRWRGECGADTQCIANHYADRIWFLQTQLGFPVAVGECVETEIAGITDRFGAELIYSASGSRVQFASGASQVSYDYESVIARSGVGDPVRICLKSIPQNCPPGDDRGRIYTTTNLSTGEAWTLPDSQHSCGGA